MANVSFAKATTPSNVDTGNSAAGARGVNYNPNTGVISGGAVGGVRDGSTDQVTAGGRGFAYNTRTDTGVAVGNNNGYASRDGNMYRYTGSENYGREILVRCAGTAVDSEMEAGCEGDKEFYPQITPIIYNVGVICGWLAPS